jgi:hypothetical protein
VEQIFHRELKGPREIRNAPQGDVARAAFNVRDISAMHVRAPREFLLRDTKLLPVRSDNVPNSGLEPEVIFWNFFLRHVHVDYITRRNRL